MENIKNSIFEEEKDYKAINQEDIEYIEWVRASVAEHAEELDEIIRELESDYYE